MYNPLMSQENIRRMVEIVEQADSDDTSPQERIRRTIQQSIQNRNPFISKQGSFLF